MENHRIISDIIPPAGAETQAWYLPKNPTRYGLKFKPRKHQSNSTSNTDVAKEAFERAVENLKTEIKDRDLAHQWINSPVTMGDISAIVSNAQKRYEKKSESKKRIMRCLTSLSSRITYYGKVFDVLAQHHPEYVSLAWGTMKFVFIVSLIGSTYVDWYER